MVVTGARQWGFVCCSVLGGDGGGEEALCISLHSQGESAPLPGLASGNSLHQSLTQSPPALINFLSAQGSEEDTRRGSLLCKSLLIYKIREGHRKGCRVLMSCTGAWVKAAVPDGSTMLSWDGGGVVLRPPHPGQGQAEGPELSRESTRHSNVADPGMPIPITPLAGTSCRTDSLPHLATALPSPRLTIGHSGGYLHCELPLCPLFLAQCLAPYL
jgi:hypothetical protein